MKSCQQQEIPSIVAIARYSYAKYLIMGLSLYKSNRMMAWETASFYIYVSDLKVTFKLEKLLYSY